MEEQNAHSLILGFKTAIGKIFNLVFKVLLLGYEAGWKFKVEG